MSRCISCGADAVEVVADLGPQPVSNRFLATPDAVEARYPMVLGQCGGCGLAQLVGPVPSSELAPPYDWITYNEPETHLDELASVVRGLPGLDDRPVAAGVSFKDDSLLGRLVHLGFGSWRVDPGADLGITHPGAGVEAVEERLTAGVAERIAAARGAADVVVARHILEHAHDIAGFVEAVGRLAKPEGYVVVEIPDCTRALETHDYCTLWEEHTAYFTAPTYTAALEAGGLTVERLITYPYPFEDSLVAVARLGGWRAPSLPAEVLSKERRRLASFVDGLPARRDAVRRHLEEVVASGGRIAFFGAGHLACTFVLLMGIADLVSFVVDDDPRKKGLFMSGSRLAIVGSGALLEEGVTLCLTALSPASEKKVLHANEAFVRGGGAFAAVIPSSPNALDILAAGRV